MNALPRDAALIIIDVQYGLDDEKYGRRNNPQAEANMARLLEAWRRTTRPIFHVQHLSREADSPLRPGQSGVEIKEVVKPLADEPVIQKNVNSAFIGTDLESRLRQGEHGTLVIAGLTTDHCVSTTARMAGNLGFNTFVVSDATATFDRVGPDGNLNDAEAIHKIALASLHGEFATITDTESLLKQVE
ncbi:MAG TPA: cysteine hydrolase family protein [Blastocatellia bacterium]|jgi:nicotinamidase-related amidase|nr:cysteine hydrolase family protein [Blastocatellia bacterium]